MPPLEVCMWFGDIADHLIDRLGGRRVSKQEAKEILGACEQAGLIHMSRNTTQDIDSPWKPNRGSPYLPRP